jgi:hypothetical protein
MLSDTCCRRWRVCSSALSSSCDMLSDAIVLCLLLSVATAAETDIARGTYRVGLTGAMGTGQREVQWSTKERRGVSGPECKIENDS